MFSDLCKKLVDGRSCVRREETLLLFEDEGLVEEEVQEASHDGVFQCGKW